MATSSPRSVSASRPADDGASEEEEEEEEDPVEHRGTACSVEEEVGLKLRYNVYLLKLGAGLCRLLLEDVLNLFVQLAFSVKYWESLSRKAQMFTISSVAAGLTLAVAAPLMDWWGCHHVSQTADAKGVYVAVASDEELLPHTDPRPDTVGEGRPSVPVYEGTILKFVADSGADSVAAHRWLVLSSVTYWGSTAALPFIYGKKIKGGTEACVPQSAVLYFVIITLASLFVELWVARHTAEGMSILRNCSRVVRSAIRERRCKEMRAFLTIAFSFLGRYDTFSDVIFACVLWKTEEIYELRLDALNGVTLHLPWPLHYFAVFSFVVGILGFQGVPGIVCLVLKKFLPAAFKLNEFNFLLGMVEYQMQ